MVSGREIKWINSLKNKKYRLIHRAYIAEGPRLVNDLVLNGQKALKIITSGQAAIAGNFEEGVRVQVTVAEMKKLSSLTQPGGVLAVFEMPAEAVQSKGAVRHPEGKWGFALDFIQDPGNLGTIMRTLDWLGISHLYCSEDSVDMYNPKVVQASMGAIARLQVIYTDLEEMLSRQSVPVYAADMDGEPLTGFNGSPGILVLGNEGRGLSESVRRSCRRSVSIPRMGGGESLNVGVAAAIFAAWFCLRQ